MTPTPSPLRVMLVDDHEVVREGLRGFLEDSNDIVVVGEASNHQEAVERAGTTHPHVIVMDVRLDQGSGIEATREIRASHPEIQILMLTSFADDQALFASIMAGAAGYVLKQVRAAELVRAIKTVGRGESLLDPAVTRSVLERLRQTKQLAKDDKLARLSGQEDRILQMVAAGDTNRQIGEALGLSEKTVKNYVSGILSKLEVTRRTQAAAYLTRHSGPGTSSSGGR